ncbi:MAG TPA: transporter substrate-binding domain-containing protein, partial [Nocardioides sp.]|nr:transporter substrate-binding domain-containing protein [Nocardioides sp.]
VPTGDPKHVDVNNPCGLTVAVQTGTVEQTDDLAPKVAACQKAGKPLKVLPYVHQTDVTAAVASGKADAMLADSPVTQYAVKLAKGKLDTVGGVYGAAPYGIVVSKSNDKLAQAIALALKDLQAKGVYDQILTTWGVQQGAITDFVVNPTVK